MKYALLIYGSGEGSDSERMTPLDPRIAAVLEQPTVGDWARLQGVESATTVRRREGKRLLTDGPFLESKEYLAGFIVLDTADLDGALAIVDDLHEVRHDVVIEVRPVLETS